MNFCRDAELGWLDADREVDPESTGPSQPGSLDDDEPGPQNPKLDQAGRRAIEQRLHQKIVVKCFSGEVAGAPVPQSELADLGYDMFSGLDSDPENPNPYAPFKSAMDWRVARWAKTRGPGSNAVSELFSIPGVSIRRNSYSIIFNCRTVSRGLGPLVR